jgi:hypothetical protein
MAKITVIVTAMSVSLSSAAAEVPSGQCLAGMRAVLIAGHFTGPLVCKKDNVKFNLVGQTAGRKYSIYDYRYRYMPKKGSVMHGGQKIIIFRKGKYIGQYALSPPPYAAVTVRGSQVVLKISGADEEVKLDFSANPPTKVFINGEMETLYR